jgi:hypothetical protein
VEYRRGVLLVVLQDKAILSVVGARRELADDWVQRHDADMLVVWLGGSQAEIVRGSLPQSSRAGWTP